MKAESLEQIKEHLQKGGMAMCHYDNRGAAFKKMPDPVYAIWNDKIVVDGWEKREHAFNSVYVDHWELAPLPVIEKRKITWSEAIEICDEIRQKAESRRTPQPADDSAFLSLPINFEEMKWEGPHGWKVTRQGKVAELLEIWNIDDENEKSEMAQVLRHLREAMR